MKILLVEDDARTADFILKGLQQSGYSTVHAATGPDGLFKAETEECDLAIIDIMLPGMDGFTLIEKLRADRITMPVIVLSAKNSVADKIRGLQNGGDDYLVKPFSFSELVARIQALLRRSYDFAPGMPIIEHRGAMLNTGDNSLSYNGKSITLTKNEYRILLCLMRNRGKVVSREKLMEKLWESDAYVDENTLSVNVNRLRKKLDSIGLESFIVTKKGLGYRLG